jgi:hypothetical protein
MKTAKATEILTELFLWSTLLALYLLTIPVGI